jgi:hypothetical protein
MSRSSVELQGDRVALGAGRGHRIEPGDRRELAFERRRDGRRHRFRRRAGQVAVTEMVGKSTFGSSRPARRGRR